MRVLILGSGSLDCATANCGRTLTAMGHDVRYFDPDEHPTYLAGLRRTWTGRKLVNRVIEVIADYTRLWIDSFLREAEDFDPALVLVIPIYWLQPSAIRTLRARTRAKLAGWFQDHVVNFGPHTFLLAEYDGLFFKDPYIVERLRDGAGLANVHFLPESCEPSIHHALPMTADDHRKFGCDLMLYGNLYAYRARLVEAVIDHDIRFYGAHPGRWLDHPLRAKWQGHPIFFDEKIRAVLGAKIVLNTSHFGEIRSANARTFEVAGIGGFQVADAPGIADYFTPGVEIATFRGPGELREVVNHYLARPEERHAMAARSRLRAHREHTYEQRLGKLMETVGLGAARPSALSPEARP